MDNSALCTIIDPMDQSYLDRIEIVLVDTQDGANIGSVCRAMKTMGLTHLTLVSDRNYDENRVFTLALHARDIYENRKTFHTIKDAIKDSIYVVGATRRRGKFRKESALSPKQLAEKLSVLPEGKVSILFGRESDGLRDEEVALCSQIVTIPTSELFPSLNLSQAVQIISYELFLSSRAYPSGIVAVDSARIEKAVRTISSSLESIGYYKWDEEKKWVEIFIKDTLSKAGLSEKEMKRFEKLFVKSATLKKYKEE